MDKTANFSRTLEGLWGGEVEQANREESYCVICSFSQEMVMIIRSFFLHNNDIIDPWLVASSLGCFSASVIVATHHDKTSSMFLWDYGVWEMARFEVQITVLSHVPPIKLSCCYLSLTECYSTVKMENIGSVF